MKVLSAEHRAGNEKPQGVTSWALPALWRQAFPPQGPKTGLSKCGEYIGAWGLAALLEGAPVQWLSKWGPWVSISSTRQKLVKNANAHFTTPLIPVLLNLRFEPYAFRLSGGSGVAPVEIHDTDYY